MTNLDSGVAAAEISDVDLDNISGGNAAGGSGALFLETPHANICADLMTVASPEGLTASVSCHAATL
ncbi:hypothetical protein [Streptomyces sp. MZ04]|uniref:hypothetical protein n=1 Tax=Streptomyces sp. MZ04 TaxID=2559236 RepID=UPI00107E7EE8|nr:hypothetical protein [Streptomyces sp. MZ04]TGA88981.1 hypothetical protein E2651_39645 [Streptomyces sp. MZ04]